MPQHPPTNTATELSLEITAVSAKVLLLSILAQSLKPPEFYSKVQHRQEQHSTSLFVILKWSSLIKGKGYYIGHWKL